MGRKCTEHFGNEVFHFFYNNLFRAVLTLPNTASQLLQLLTRMFSGVGATIIRRYQFACYDANVAASMHIPYAFSLPPFLFHPANW